MHALTETDEALSDQLLFEVFIDKQGIILENHQYFLILCTYLMFKKF